MSFQDLTLQRVYDSSKLNINDSVITPLLSNSKWYYRGVGYFTSNWLSLVLEGIKDIVKNKGKILLLTSPELSAEDWEAVKKAELAKKSQLLYEIISTKIDEEISVNTKKDLLNLFSWLIIDGYIEIKFVICTNRFGMFHDKWAIFEDNENNLVCLHGSLNDSLHASFNGESVSLFRSWNDEQNEYIKEHLSRFFEVWEGKNKYYQTLKANEILSSCLQKYRTSDRPYDNPLTFPEEKKIDIPEHIQIRGFQKEAIEALEKNNWLGIFEMATGTGKTIASISAAVKYYQQNGQLFLVVIAPFNHLVNQWENNLTDFGFTKILKCNISKKKWLGQLNTLIKDYGCNLVKSVCVVTTYGTASSSAFINEINKVEGSSMLIADECHYIGSRQNSKAMLSNYSCKLGLSATPDRWFDEEGSDFLRQYFNGTVFEYGIEKAIRNNFLTKYKYIPIPVKLTTDEQKRYDDLSAKISKSFAMGERVDESGYLKNLLFKRTEIISKAESKSIKLIELLNNKKNNVSHTLLYCAKGETKKYTKVLSNLGISTHEFIYETEISVRSEILKLFHTEEIKVIVAIKCLDEGVDVPSTREAIFLSSTSNPREFIQRRGRVLRKYEGKKFAIIYDFIIFPSENSDSEKILFSELPRFAEFAAYAENKYEARKTILPYVEPYNLEYLMDLTPWESQKIRREQNVF